MTTKTEPKEAKQLKQRNIQVQQAYFAIIENLKPLLKPFTGQKYRTHVLVDHSNSGKETTLISEFMTCFFNVTLSCNKVGYLMIYFKYDEAAISKFGARLYNRALRQLFLSSTFEGADKHVEDCIRVSNHANVEAFYINRLVNGENDFTSIGIEEQ